VPGMWRRATAFCKWVWTTGCVVYKTNLNYNSVPLDRPWIFFQKNPIVTSSRTILLFVIDPNSDFFFFLFSRR
jgi:hypothetical protein